MDGDLHKIVKLRKQTIIVLMSPFWPYDFCTSLNPSYVRFLVNFAPKVGLCNGEATVDKLNHPVNKKSSSTSRIGKLNLLWNVLIMVWQTFALRNTGQQLVFLSYLRNVGILIAIVTFYVQHRSIPAWTDCTLGQGVWRLNRRQPTNGFPLGRRIAN